MTDYRDPTYRDPNLPRSRDPDLAADGGSWSSATWGWIAGIAVVVLVMLFIFSSGPDTPRTTSTAPSTTTGESTTPPAMRPQAPAPANPAPQQAPAPQR
jgi:hypothetical protein